jgi:DNA-binding response OmpR family regulator
VEAGKAVAGDYMTKPFDPLELLSLVATLMPSDSSGA